MLAADVLVLDDRIWTWLGYATIGLGVVAALLSIILGARARVRGSDGSRAAEVADVRATISQLAQPTAGPAVPAQLAAWEQQAAEVARRQLDLYLRNSSAALRQSSAAFLLGMTAASLGFLAILGSLGWLLAAGKDIAWLGVISGGICEAVAGLFFGQVRATRARTQAMLERAQADADRVVRARSALAVAQSIEDMSTREGLLADIGRSLLGEDQSVGRVTGRAAGTRS